MPNSKGSRDGGNPLFILYGSATGNAEHIAKDLAAAYGQRIKLKNVKNQSADGDAGHYFDSVVCCEADQFKKKCLPIWEQDPAKLRQQQRYYGVLVVASTTGNGDAPENCSRFVRWMKRKPTAASQPMKHCAFAVLGLGDTNYDQFCHNGKTIDRKLEELGGCRAQPIACADEATGLEDVVEPWKETIFSVISRACFSIHSAMVDDHNMGSAANGTKGGGEEKKMEPPSVEEFADAKLETKSPVAIASVSAPEDLPSSTSTGLDIVRHLLKLEKGAPINAVDDPKQLPSSLTSALSSCTLLDEQKREKQQLGRLRSESLSTTSSGPHYTAKKPFESTVLNARYLTATSTEASRIVCRQKLIEDENPSLQNLAKAMSVYDEEFPLSSVRDCVDAETAERNGKRVIELTLSLPEDISMLEYAPGDSLGMLVQNPPLSVGFVLDMFAKRHGVSPEQHLQLDDDHPVTVQEAVRGHFDMSSLVSKRVLFALSQHATDPHEANALQLLSCKTPEGCQLYHQYVEEQHMTVVDVLREFESCQSTPLEALLSILPSIPPRYYSVTSSPLEHPRSLTIAFSVVDYLTPSLPIPGRQELGRRRVGGVATRYLEAVSSAYLGSENGGEVGRKTPAVTLPIFPKPTTDFRMPKALSTPLILIGPGTGVAPFMGFLQHRRQLLCVPSESKTAAAAAAVEGTWRGGYDMEENELPMDNNNISDSVGSVDLLFGCRHRDHDWLYRDEMKALAKDGVLTKLYTAFSRDAPCDDDTTGSEQRQKYVQHFLLCDAACSRRTADLITKRQAHVYLCGDGTAMAKDVQAAIVELLRNNESPDIEDPQAYLKEMKKSGRFLMDIWS